MIFGTESVPRTILIILSTGPSEVLKDLKVVCFAELVALARSAQRLGSYDLLIWRQIIYCMMQIIELSGKCLVHSDAANCVLAATAP